MRKKKKIFAAFITAGMIASSSGVVNIQASQEKYSDNNVSLISAIDNYVETNDQAFINEFNDSIQLSQDNVKSFDSDKVANKVEEEQKETSEVTGSIVAVAVDDRENVNLDNEKTTEENTTEEATTEEATTEEATTEDGSSSEEIPVSYQSFEGKAIVTAGGYVNIRSGASTDDSIVATINNGGLVNIEENGNEWSLVSSGNCKGYIKNDLLAFDDDARAYADANLTKVAVITASSLSLRQGQGTESECLSMLPNGERYRVLEIGNAWTKVEVDDSLSGYVSNEYIEIGYNTSSATAVEASQDDSSNESEDNDDEETTTEETTEESSEDNDEPASDVPASSTGIDIANFALQFVGNPYVWGGTSLTEGADCSGFVMRVFEHFQYQLPRTADVQAEVGTPISLAALAPGDLLFYDHGSGSIQHVAIYIGDGQIVHASNSTTGIIVSNAYYSTPCKAVRIAE